jgi:hypothetical protein
MEVHHCIWCEEMSPLNSGNKMLVINVFGVKENTNTEMMKLRHGSVTAELMLGTSCNL